ncbi:hypothetical protein [Halalkalibacter alkaliphilus]|uniref:Uncharacterized protein n=1 Tax=Halalkalibacter alkaliphilus TaxID=2917993 RepID=A0A9X2CRC7_9BACI|nr:hypothetical protein [Halalkalibacter alkaliphilus]MCL7745814.1 hypothetical protein [Halalkalibacter alkaliphilus]
MKDLLKMIESDLKQVAIDLLEQGKSISVGEVKDERKGYHSQYVIKAKIGLNENNH